MPATSKAQQAAAGIALAAKRGDIPKSKLRGASKAMSKMSSSSLGHFAKTKASKLPAHSNPPSAREAIAKRVMGG
jgi:hypothetical protein